MPIGTIDLADDHLVIAFPYDPTQVAEVKQIHGAKWDKVARVWRAPMSSLQQVRAFANKHDLASSPDVDMFTLPDQTFTQDGLERDGDYVLLNFTYDPVKVKLVKQIPGVTWHAATKAWRAPITSLSTAISWAERFDLHIPDELVTEAATMDQARSEMIAASRSTDADIEIAGLVGSLFPYQRGGIKFASSSRRCFLADDMGLGKTVQGIGTLEYTNSVSQPSYPAVIVCPPKLVLNWQKEYAKWMPHRNVACVTDRKTFPDGYDVVVVGWSNITHWAERLGKHRAYIFDESHSAKNPTAQRTKAAVKITKTAPKDAIILMLTGTPITNRPAEYAPQLQVLGKLDKFGGLYGFYRTYCAAFKDKWGHWHLDGASNLDELNDRLRGEGLYIRRTKEQVLPDLPPVLHDRIVVEGDGAAMREYRKAESDIIAYLVERAKQLALEMGLSPGSAAVRAKMAAESNEHLVRISVLRKLAARAKMEAVYEYVDGHIENGMKVVVAAHHREIVDDLSSKYGGLKIQGGQKVDDVETTKARFQSDPVTEAPVIVLSIQAAKEGHTLTASQTVLFVELPWHWADVEQTYSRCHRIGQKGSVTSTYLLCAGTVDEEIFDLLQRKREVVRVAVDGGEMGVVDVSGEIVGRLLQLGLDNME
jgi:SNF2 family DNA or RNA helicase